jgi:AcrR family transcriptional regulator
VRSDAQRSVEALLLAAKQVFATSGVEAPVREIAEQAGVGVATLYRHFPERSDLVAAVFRHEVTACAEAAPTLAAQFPPDEALARWMDRFVDFVGTKRGLATALHSGNPAFQTLPGYFGGRLVPALQLLLEAAAAAGTVRGDVNAEDLLNAAGNICRSAYEVGPDHAKRIVGLLVDGLRYGAGR